MTVTEIKSILKTEAYDFLRTNPMLNRNVIMLTLGGSHAYGTNVDTSDIDIRGCALNSKKEILLGRNFEQFTNDTTDTVIYSFNKLISLLSNVNPNTIELLGNKPEHYLYLSDIGRELISNSHMFLSKRAINSFGGYANAQLRRLSNKAARDVSQSEKEMHILKSIEHASETFKQEYFNMSTDSINLYIDSAINDELDSEIFMDIRLDHYPLRDYKCMWAEMNNIVKEYGKIGVRNKKAIEHDKLGKHMMHLVRLYLMCFDILEKELIITYREDDHELLMNIRNGMYLDSDKQPTAEFYELINDLENRLEYAKKNTSLPDHPNYKLIDEFVATINERIVRDEL